MYELSYRMPPRPLARSGRAQIQNRDLTSNLDFAQTFLDLRRSPSRSKDAGSQPVPLLKGEKLKDWLKSAISLSRGRRTRGGPARRCKDRKAQTDSLFRQEGVGTIRFEKRPTR